MATDDMAEGPGKAYVSPCGVVGIAGYLAALAVAFIWMLVCLWPSCEVPSSESAQGSTALILLSLSPSSGRIAGGEVVTIRGMGFVDHADVMFGTSAATEIDVKSPTAISARTPAHAPGRVDVTVKTRDKKSQLSDGFIYYDPQNPLPKASVAALTPTAGPLEGGQTVTIVGAGFAGVASVGFGGVPGTSVRIIDDRTLTVITPPHADGKVDVIVGDRDGASATVTGGYAFTCWGTKPFRLFLMVVAAGALGGTLHALRSLFWYVGNRQLRQSWILMYVLLPFSGAAVAVVFFLIASAGLYTVQGTGSFVLIGLATLVGMFSPQAVEKLKKIAEGILTTVPPGSDHAPPQKPDTPGPGDLKVKSVASDSGSTAGGEEVKITGTGFTNGATVSFGGTAGTNVIVNSAGEITATTPAHSAGPVDVVVTNPDKKTDTLTQGYTYSDPDRESKPAGTTEQSQNPDTSGPGDLKVKSVAPDSGSTAGGKEVKITGTGFTNEATVSFGEAAGTKVSVNSAEEITATTPAHSAGPVDVVVTNPDKKTDTLTQGYTYSDPGQGPKLAVTSVAEPSGPKEGGKKVTITGTGFSGQLLVTFGDVPATDVVVVNESTIKATTPAHSPGVVIVEVGEGAAAATLPNGFTYED